MALRTPLYDFHCQSGGLMVDFAGWQMPLHYGSQIAEHNAVRQRAGIFDVSHMGIVDIQGRGAQAFLRYVLANDVNKLNKNGLALYSCLLNHQGGIIDDLIAYRLQEDFYRLVINASRRAADFEWLKQQSSVYQLNLQERHELAIIAVQGPQALLKVQQCLESTVAVQVSKLRPFQFVLQGDWQISRTGYTGEAGVEIILPAEHAPRLWQALLAQGLELVGLGARDTLRLEAGLNLYGADMDETTTPLESNLEWTVGGSDPTRHFIGCEALAQQKQHGVERRLVGLVMKQPGVLRNHQRVWVNGKDAGEITSGSFSPTLNCAIAMARISVGIAHSATVERRGIMIPVEIISLPFLKRRQSTLTQTIQEQT